MREGRAGIACVAVGRLAIAALILSIACGGSGDSSSNGPATPVTPTTTMPTLTSVSPSSGSAGSTTNVVLSGTGFVSGATTVSVAESGVSVADVTVSGATSLSAGFIVDAAAAAGTRGVTVTTAGGTSGSQTFTINPAPIRPPTLTAVAPSTGVAGSMVNVTLTGTNFATGATTVAVSGSGVTVGSVTVSSAGSLTTSFAIGAAATPGTRSVTVTTAAGASPAQTFTIAALIVGTNSWPVPAYNGATGKGVIIAILDRGIQYQHPDFIKPDGTTRIKGMLDMTGQSYCSATNPAPVEYTEAQINAALRGGAPLGMRDAVGHGTVTAGIATGNGSAAAGGKFAGVAPEADILVVKLTSDGAPGHDTQPAEAAFTACYDQALDWIDQKVAALNEPVVTLINSGVMLWGPTDGTSALSRKIDALYANRPGHIFISPSGDEGGLATHAGGSYSNAPVTVSFHRQSATASQLAMWYTGSAPAQVTIAFDDGTTIGPVAPGQTVNMNSVFAAQYPVGQEFYPATSTSGDHFVSISITGHATTGLLTIQPTNSATGRFDLYSDAGATTTFDDHVVPGRLTDQSATKSAIVVGASVNANSWVDIDNVSRTVASDVVSALWSGSGVGPTRDGRMGMDIIAAGEGVFAAYSTSSYWGTLRFDLVQGSNGYYGRQGATSGASPILTGAVALMLQFRPTLTNEQARALIRNTAISDGNTGATPNNAWGYGKLNIMGLIDQVSAGSTSARRRP